MNITFTADDIATLCKLCIFYRDKPQAHKNPLTEEERALLLSTLRDIGLNEKHERDSLHTLTLTPAEWWALRDALSIEISSWKEIVPTATIPLNYLPLLQKLDTYSLASHVEEALIAETISEPA